MNCDVLELHRSLVAIPSVSGNEAAIADFVQDFWEERGIEVSRLGNNVIARAGRGPKLLWNSHLDTVPANDGWTREPWKPEVVGDRVYGLGSNDAKASVAGMMAALCAVQSRGGPCEVVLLLAQQEETGGDGTETAWPWVRKELGFHPSGVVVGEPTGLEIGIAQKGLLIVDLVARGDACHAAHAARLGAENAIWRLADDLVRLRQMDLGEAHALLGGTSLQPTMLLGAAIHNQVPPEARATLDLRTVPGRSHREWLAQLQEHVQGEILARSSRLEPYACPPEAAIVQAALAARAESRLFGSATMSDQVFFSDVPAIKCGPGQTDRSHTADEFVLESEILEGADFYGRLADVFAREVA